MIPSWGYPPQKRPDPGRYGPLRLLGGNIALQTRDCASRPAGKVCRSLQLLRKFEMGTSAMRETEASFWMVQTTSLTRAMRFAAIALGVGLVMAAGPVRAADDDDEDDRTFEEKI